MKPLKQVGFTIIETMLFLGITGLLVVGVLAGTGNSINVQRYRDSVTSLQSLLQQQYSEVSNVSNDHGLDWSCNDVAEVEPLGSNGSVSRGQSDCVILGRFITTNNNGKALSIKNVIGYPSSTSVAPNDIVMLKSYTVKISPRDQTVYEMEWDSSIVKPGGNSAMNFSLLILRSPSSGVMRTFINPSIVVKDIDIATLIDQSALLQPVKMCVNPNGVFISGKTAVLIVANATNASGVETLGEAVSGC